MSASTQQHAKQGLANALKATQPELAWNNDFYLAEAECNVLPGLVDQFWPVARTQLIAGDGGELSSSGGRPPKFAAAHSSSALAVNSFGPWMNRSESLLLGDITNFDGSLEFEAKCHNGFGPRASNLDVLLRGATATYGVESKLTEWLGGAKGSFSEAYMQIPDNDPRRTATWFRLMESMVEGSVGFKYLDAVQLVKHFFGLSHTFHDLPVRLIYIFWEPTNAFEFAEFAAHRAEVEQFRGLTQDADNLYLMEALSYSEHWRELEANPGMPDWLPEHLAALRARYEIAICA